LASASAQSEVPDLLGSWGTLAAAPAPDDENDLLGSWGSTKAQPEKKKVLSLTVHPASTRKADETLSESVNRMVAEHQGDSLADAFARLTGGAARGVGDVADTMAQGIGYAGERGARALQGAGVISPGTAAAVADWRSRINQDIRTDQEAFDAASAGSPLATGGRLVGQIAGTAPFLAAGGGALTAATRGAPLVNAIAARPVVSAAVRGAAAGAGANALTSAASDQSLGEQLQGGATAGALLGPVGFGLGKAASKLLGVGIDRETAALATAATDKYGIPVRSDQISSNPMVRFAGSVMQRLPFTGLGEHVAEQQTAFNRAVANEFGETADKITRPVIKAAKDRIGDVFEDVARRTGAISIDQPFMNDVTRIVHDARSVLGKDAEPVVSQVNRIADRIDFTSNSLKAESYQSLTRKDTPLDRAMHSADPNVRYYAGQLREALDDAMERSAPGDAVHDLRKARYQWAIMKAIEPLAKKAPTGDISPALVLAKSKGGNLEELGQVGQRFLKEPPSSGTSERLAVMKVGAGLASGAAGLGGAAYFDPEHFQRDIAGLAAAAVAAKAGGKALASNALARALLRGSQSPATRRLPQIGPGVLSRAGALGGRSLMP
jgi:hypothetical protein